jgi:3-hydroxybutyryl-CoA dehydratase
MTPFDRHFDELEEGERFSTRGRTVTEADVVLFAGLSGDMHPQHTDAEWAAGSRFGERIAHGMLILSYAVGLMPFDPDRVVALRRVGDVVFKQPARIGDTIRVEGELADRRELDDGHGLVTCRWRILNQTGKLVARATVEVVWRREQAQVPVEPEREPVLI